VRAEPLPRRARQRRRGAQSGKGTGNPRDEGRLARRGRSPRSAGAAERRHSAAPSARRRDHQPRARTDRELVVPGGGRTTTRRYDDEQFVAGFHRVRGTLGKSMPVNTGGLPHRDVAAATCDGAAVERGRGREAGVLMVARQGEARVVRMDTLAYVWAVPATRTNERTGSPHVVS